MLLIPISIGLKRWSLLNTESWVCRSLLLNLSITRQEKGKMADPNGYFELDHLQKDSLDIQHEFSAYDELYDHN